MLRYSVGMTPQFKSSVARLDPQTRSEVFEAAMKVVEGQAATHVHKLTDSEFFSFSVNRNALRVVCLRDAETLILLHAAPHDQAYDWAKRHRTVRVGDVVRFVSIATEEVRAFAPVEPVKGPLADVRDRVFQHFGIGPRGARVLRLAADDDEVMELAEVMQPAVGLALIGLATDPDDLPALVRQYEDARRVPEPAPAPLAEVLRAPANASAVWLPSTAQALKSALEGRLEDWRVFLHPSQEALVRRQTKGAAMVTGGPGTGKTVVALHRARVLAEAQGPVLLTTFGRTLTEQLSDLVTQLCDDDASLLDRLEVASLVAVSQAVSKRAGLPHALVTDEVLDACWAEALAADTVGWTRRQYEAEREHVVARNGAWTEAQYLTTTRAGRAKGLDRSSRRKVWAVLSAFEVALAQAGGGDAMALARDATRAVATGAVASPWRAVVCDEVQDASASQLRLLAALARDPATGEIRPDGLFLCGDGYQRLYASPVSLVSCGIEVRGRSRKLRLNYRTTEAIRRAAIEVVQGLDPDDLEHLTDADDAPLDGYRSLRGGPPPVVMPLPSEAEEAAWIAEQGRAGPLMVLVRTAAYRDALAERLRAAGLPVHVLEGAGSLAEVGVTLCTLHRSKGLEAPRVVVAGRQLVPGRFPGGDPAERRLFDRQERCLLYVGMTRARDWLAVTSVVAGRSA